MPYFVSYPSLFPSILIWRSFFFLDFARGVSAYKIFKLHNWRKNENHMDTNLFDELGLYFLKYLGGLLIVESNTGMYLANILCNKELLKRPPCTSFTWWNTLMKIAFTLSKKLLHFLKCIQQHMWRAVIPPTSTNTMMTMVIPFPTIVLQLKSP